MQNIFLEYPEFINSDVRRVRSPSPGGSYNINADFQYVRHQLTLPKSVVANKSVLDLGSCVGATGAWVLANGASRYVGVDIQTDFCTLAKQNLTNRFTNSNWNILQQSFTDFFTTNTEHFDVVVAFGIIYQSVYFEELIKQIVKLNPDTIVVDSSAPSHLRELLKNNNIVDPELINKVNQLPFVEYKNYTMILDSGDNAVIESAVPTLSALQILLMGNSYKLGQDLTQDLIATFPDNYQGRYCGVFEKTSEKLSRPDFETAYTTKPNIIPLNTNPAIDHPMWVFDNAVADQFGDHARQHIQDYDMIISLSIDICQQVLPDPHNDRVIDVGSAVGETVKRLYAGGFHNLVGVDSSKEMLAKSQHLPIAQWIHSNKFPVNDGPYRAVICNWTLHFIQNKIEYLTDVYKGMTNGGVLIITDKTSNSGLELELYHNFKRTRGVSAEDITAKAASVKDIMYIDPPEWYLHTLKELGFESVSIVNAGYCFTTFLAVKPAT